MNNTVNYRVDLPGGLEIWIIPLENDTIRWRAFFQHEEVGMDWLSGKITKEGLNLLANKIKEITNN